MIETETRAPGATAAELAAEHLRFASSSWSIGTFGAIAEFAWSAEDAAEPAALSLLTRRGGIRFEARPDVTVRAYEVMSARRDNWHHGVAFCLPEREAAMHGRGAIAEIGPDEGAMRAEDRGAIMFDLGVGGPTCDFCVRTADPGLIATLRSVAGAELGVDGTQHRLWPMLVAASPHRVALSRLGRIEVYQHIAGPGGRTPSGPHTHLIPRLLRQSRTHSASIPVPVGTQPVLNLYPPNPVQDEHGNAKPFDREEHSSFQALLERCGDPGAWAAKRRLLEAIGQDRDPHAWRRPQTRGERTACRIALRQFRLANGAGSAIDAWERALAGAGRQDADTQKA